MQDQPTAPRSEQDTSGDAEDANSLPSNVSKAAPSTARGRTHPTTITARVSYATKGRAKDAARARGVSLCDFVRKAIHSALRDHADGA